MAERTGPAPSRPETARSGHRLDVQGMRAVAVLAVLVFHAGLALPGGFVGVDIFFVISGFVITAMLMREFEQHGRIRLKRFYLRRFKRLFPALALTVAVTLLATVLILSPGQYQEIAALTGLGGILLSSNFVIMGTSGGYFGAKAELNPLLHVWSLSVEEQFYLVFPAILIGAVAWGARRRSGPTSHARPALTAVLVMSALSLGLVVVNTVATGVPALTGFYSPLPRVWEFGAGALLALVPHAQVLRTRFQTVMIALAGAGLLAISFVVIDETMAWPGPAMLLPVLGTMALIGAGSAPHANPVTWLLGTRPMTLVGDWSYSLYLWHWAPVVFAQMLWPNNSTAKLVAVALSVTPAVASYYLLENPIRKAPGLTGARFVRLAAVTALVPAAVSGALYAGAANNWGSDAVAAFVARVEPQHIGMESGCDGRTPLGGHGTDCAWNLEADGAPVYLVGDSSMDHFTDGWIEAGREAGRPVFSATASACPFLLDVTIRDVRHDQSLDDDCHSYVTDSLDYLADAPQGTVVIANSQHYPFQREVGLGPGDGDPEGDFETKLQATREGLEAAVAQIRELGHQVVIIQGTPLWIGANHWESRECTTLAVLRQECGQQMTLAEGDEQQGRARGVVEEVAAHTGATVWDSWMELCEEGVCSTHDGLYPRFRDGLHITVEQSRLLGPSFARLL
ncbi:acyltransferase family protein [Tessaracoccus terricola]